MDTVSLLAGTQIEDICRQKSDLDEPPQAFLISESSTQNALLAISLDFLSEGADLSWPGLPLLGATFDLDWGFASASINNPVDGLAEFIPQFYRAGDSESGGTFGYRFCPTEYREMPRVISELAYIRHRLSEPRPRQDFTKYSATPVLITDL